MMRPSVYHAELAKDQLVEDRRGVKVTFAGGNVFHVHVEGAAGHFSVRGVRAAFERSEAERHKLDPEYQPIPYVKPDQLTKPVSAETEGAQVGATPAAPADNGDDTNVDHGEAKADEQPDIPPGDTDDVGDPEQPLEIVEGEEATRGDKSHVIALEGGQWPVQMVAVEVVEAALGVYQERLPGFIGDARYRRLQDRVRATDGRCAPVFFVSHEEGAKITFLAGLETLGAAKHLGMHEIAVVIVPAETARVSQGPISALFSAANAQVADGDEEMVYRAYN